MGVAQSDPFFAQVGSKNGNFWRFYHIFFFFRTTGLQLKLLILIESPNIFYWKPAKKSVCSIAGKKFKLGPMLKKVKKVALSIGFFHNLHGNTF